MRRLIAAALVLACVSALPARAGSISLGAFGGMTYPVLQSDVGNGTLYGVRAPVKLVPFLTVEPYWATSSLGDKVVGTPLGNITNHGFDETAYGASVMLATPGPLSFYPIGSVGKTTIKIGGTSNAFTTYGGGIGLGVSAVPKVTLNLRAEFQAIAGCPAHPAFRVRGAAARGRSGRAARHVG